MGFRQQTDVKLYGDCADIVRKSCSLRTEIRRSLCGFHTEAVQRWYHDCDRCVVFGIRVPKVYSLTFLLVFSVEMATKTSREWKEVQGGECRPIARRHLVIVQSLWGCFKITTFYPCSFMGTAPAPCENLAVAARSAYNYPKSL